MNSTDFAGYVSDFFRVYLPGKRQLSENTIMAYRDTFKLLFLYASDVRGIASDRLELRTITDDFVFGFLTWLGEKRHCSESTKRQRLAALHGFINYLKSRCPDYLSAFLKILEVKVRKPPQRQIGHLSPKEMKELLNIPNLDDMFNLRDITLLDVMYEGGLRVQEACDLVIQNIRLDAPGVMTVKGKGEKTRLVPLLPATLKLVRRYVKRRFGDSPSPTQILFTNHKGEKLTRIGVAYILKKHGDRARKSMPDFPERVTPHMLRHSKAMHLKRSGATLVEIRDFLGHSHISTTEIYAKADPEQIRKVLDDNALHLTPGLKDWRTDTTLMSFLNDLCRK